MGLSKKYNNINDDGDNLILIELVVFIYLYVYYNLPNGCKDPVKNWQM